MFWNALAVLMILGQATCQTQSFKITFEADRFDEQSGRLKDPVQGFNFGDFSIITAPTIPGNSVSATGFTTSLLRPCSPRHYVVRIAPNLQDATTDRGTITGIKIATVNGVPAFRSFDSSSICMGCVFVAAATQGNALPEPIGTDPLAKFALPASCVITVTGTTSSTPPETIVATLPFKARPPLDAADLTNPMFLVTDMTNYTFSNRWRNLVSLEFKISKAVVEPPVNLPPQLKGLLQTGGLFSSIAIDNFFGVKQLSSGMGSSDGGGGGGGVPIP
ncbi:hypothetical protein Dda_8302 [Drechslerella dactyloides]|uniref:Uncharacterized protein n=1 Tax=Drechslerella dactyloides TaxID=74499 RepID=A0AAD6IVZ7_DREDA|nr:hypothetical protein Dda_8302 [Drechslerella dactyloides]